MAVMKHTIPKKADLDLPKMSPCFYCKRDGTQDELFVLTEKGWTCRDCFRKGPGQSWPKPRRKR